ncbi:MAG: hypothetical protein ACE5EO_03885 [Candidatus Krumholzibacteriia bacterium]
MISPMLRPCVLVLVIAALAGCSSDPDSPLGSEFRDTGLIGSDPGEVFLDTVVVASGDTSLVTNAVIANFDTITAGRTGDIEKAILLRFNMAGADPSKSVQEAVLNLSPANAQDGDVINVQIFELLDSLVVGKSLKSLNLSASAISDPFNSGAIDRTMEVGTTQYALEPSLVESWIDSSWHNGIAIVVMDAITNQELAWESSDKDSTGLFLRVKFADNSQSFHRTVTGVDATFFKSLAPVTNLRVSDGETRRVFLPIDLTGVGSDTLLHDARLAVTIVPGAGDGGVHSVTLYAPLSSDENNSGFLFGTAVSTVLFDADKISVIRFPVRSIVEDFIANPGSNNGLVLQFTFEGASTRRIEFYGSGSGPGLGPLLSLTFSNSPRFPR